MNNQTVFGEMLQQLVELTSILFRSEPLDNIARENLLRNSIQNLVIEYPLILLRRTDGSKCFTEHYDALDEDGREGGDEEWIVDDGVCADGGTVFGFFDASHRSRTIIHDASGTLTILTLSGR